MQLTALTNQGRERARNEDNCLARSSGDRALLVVADGMGGHRAGNVASALAVETAEHYWLAINEGAPLTLERARGLVSGLIIEANKAILAEAESSLDHQGMGTTLTAGLLAAGRLTIGHIGDSRAYLISNGRISLLTKDHSLLEQLIDSGQVSIEEAVNHPQRHVLTRALGSHLDPQADIDLVELELEPGSTLLLCTDGLTNMVGPEEILSMSQEYPEPDLLGEALIDLANARGGFDNITVVLACGIGEA